ncbi:MAG: aldehyde dehydrogenase family protein [Gammaproteobacteria bacterium]|nr:aldehyde dehydrogenase family protein [Gammaproteobacteria bacterium]
MKFKTISPIDNSVYVERDYANKAEIESTLEKARLAQQKWAKTSITERTRLCLKIVEKLLEKKEDIAKEICWQMGRPIKYCEGEIKGFAERAIYMISIATDKLSPIDCNDQAGFNRYIEREPVGIVFSIAPWNFPYLTAVNSIIPAIMSGNAVIMKPSSQTPLSAERIFEATLSAGLPEGVFSYLYLSHDATEALVGNAEIDFVCFTGSVSGGHKIVEAANKRFIGLGLELGGKDPAYVREDADLDYSVETLVDGAFFNSGQSCCGIERVYVHESIYQTFVDKYSALVSQYKLGRSDKDDTTLGPMVNTKAADLVRQQTAEAIAKGALPLIDNTLFDADADGTPYLAPQVLVNVDHTMSVMRDESFGPVVGIMKVSSDEEAIQLMNDSEFGLTASVWTKDETAAIEIGKQVQTGTWFMNRCDYLDPALAWAGVKNSGHGCTLSEIGYEQLTRPKSFHLKSLS